jgi:hypothetical protein
LIGKSAHRLQEAEKLLDFEFARAEDREQNIYHFIKVESTLLLRLAWKLWWQLRFNRKGGKSA